MSLWMPYLLVGLGGFIGANARFVLTGLVGAAFHTRRSQPQPTRSIEEVIEARGNTTMADMLIGV